MPLRGRRVIRTFKDAFAAFRRRAPVTLFLACAIVCFHFTREICSLRGNGGERGIDAAFGSVVPLATYRPEHAANPNGPMVPIRQLEGPFDLWDGQWWRVFISAFHHADLVHLVVNVLALCYLGMLLEPRMNRGWYLLFFLVSCGISLIPEFLLEHYAVGISGGLCAMFGVLWVLRKNDWKLREVLTQASVRTTMGFLVACIPLTLLGAVNIANVAHFTGLAYGVLTGVLFFAGRFNVWIARVAFLAVHASVLPGLYYAVHPTWNGRYYWHLAHHASMHGDWAGYQRDLEQAVAHDRRLTECWNELALYRELIAHDPLAAWQTIVAGVNFNRSDEKGMEIARALFQQLSTTQQDDAIRILREQFGNEAGTWQERLTHQDGPRPLLPWADRANLPPAHPARAGVPRADKS